MKISTKGRYALRLMLDLAYHDSGGYTSLKTISTRQGISEKYLEQIINVLCKAEYVRSVRGANGGYKLGRAPKDYTVGDILRLTEGNLAPVACLCDDDNNCPRCDSCVTLGVWKELADAIDGVLDHITLEELVNRQKHADGVTV